MLKNIIYLVIFLILILSIVMLVKSIKSKNKLKCIYLSAVALLYMIYLFVIVYFIYLVNVNLGLEFLLYVMMMFASGILMIISIIINIIKIKKNNIDISNINFMPYLLVLILPIVLIISAYLHEIVIIHNSELFLEHRANTFGEESYKHAINGKKCYKIDIDERKIKKNGKEIYRDIYNISYDNGINILKSYYEDNQLSDKARVNIEKIIKQLIGTDTYKKYINENYIITFDVSVLEDSNYYIIVEKASTSSENSGIHIYKGIYKGDKYISSCDVGFDKIVFYTK